MIDALVSSAALTGPASPGAVPTAPADLSDVERFRSAMMSGQTMPAPATLEKAALGIAPQAPDLAVQSAADRRGQTSLGDTILSTLQDLSSDTKQRYGQVGELLGKPQISMSELMSLQYTLLQTSVQFEIASKGISKFTQNLDSVLKTQ